MIEIIPKEKIWKALSIGTFTGWFCVGIIDFFTIMFMSGSVQNLLSTFFVGFFFYLIFGLPIAFMLCFLMGIPIYLITQRFRQIDRYRAILIGTIMGALLGSLSLIWFSTAYQNIWIWLDWISTILVGGFAGYVSFHFTKQKDLFF